MSHRYVGKKTNLNRQPHIFFTYFALQQQNIHISGKPTCFFPPRDNALFRRAELLYIDQLMPTTIIVQRWEAMCLRFCGCFSPREKNTLQGINISHLGKRKITFKMPFLGDMLVPWRVSHSLPAHWLELGDNINMVWGGVSYTYGLGIFPMKMII